MTKEVQDISAFLSGEISKGTPAIEMAEAIYAYFNPPNHKHRLYERYMACESIKQIAASEKQSESWIRDCVTHGRGPLRDLRRERVR